MNTQFVAILLALIFPLASAATPGEHKGNFEHHFARKIERLNQKLSLSDDQKARLETLFGQQREKVKTAHEETQAQLQTILTAEQYSRVQEMKQHPHEKWHEKYQAKNLEKSHPPQ